MFELCTSGGSVLGVNSSVPDNILALKNNKLTDLVNCISLRSPTEASEPDTAYRWTRAPFAACQSLFQTVGNSGVTLVVVDRWRHNQVCGCTSVMCITVYLQRAL